MPDLDDVRGGALAALNALGMAATIVGVPILVARRLVGPRRVLVAPVALAIGAGLTIATRRSAWSLVQLWLGISERGRRGRGQSSGR